MIRRNYCYHCSPIEEQTALEESLEISCASFKILSYVSRS